MWDNDSPGASILVEREVTSGGNVGSPDQGVYRQVAQLPESTHIWTDLSAISSSSYNYRIRAVNVAGNSSYSNVAGVTTSAFPANIAQPTALNATAVSPTTVNVTWNDPSVAGNTYLIQRSSDNLEFANVGYVSSVLSFQDQQLTPGTTYYYRVQAIAYNQSLANWTPPFSATTPALPSGVPAQPQNVAALVNSATAVTLSWNNPSGATIQVQRKDYYGSSFTTVGTTSAGAASYTDTTAAAESAYYYRLVATGSGGDTDPTIPLYVVTASADNGSQTYDVGPGQPYTMATVPWTHLGPGDTVRIHWQATPYYDKILLSSRGTAAEPITIQGVPDASGDLPIMDATNAVSLGGASQAAENRGLIMVSWRTDQNGGYKPGYLVVENLQLQNARDSVNYTPAAGGAPTPYASNVGGFFLKQADDVTLAGCIITNNNQGIVASGTGTDDYQRAENLMVEGNYIYNNGVAGSEYLHEVYDEVQGAVYQYNHFGPVTAGSSGFQLKDRSVGTVVRYNEFTGNTSALDLIEPEGSFSLVFNRPDYNSVPVYGNIFYIPHDMTQRIITFGADDWEFLSRRGPLEFYNNTVVSIGDYSKRGWSILFHNADNPQTVDARNNILYIVPETPGQLPSYYTLVEDAGMLYTGINWISSGWLPSKYGVLGAVNGTSNLITNAQNDPGFTDVAAGNYTLTPGSQALGEAWPLPADVQATYAVNEQYTNQAVQPRVSANDLGAYGN